MTISYGPGMASELSPGLPGSTAVFTVVLSMIPAEVCEVSFASTIVTVLSMIFVLAFGR